MANQQAAVPVTGFVAGDPTLGGTESFRVLTFRMGSTRSRLNPTTRQWEDYGTAWVGVKAFRALAGNGNANGAVEGMDGGNGHRASSPYVRPTQYGAGGAASGVGIAPYATSSESGPVEFGVTSDSGQSPSPSTESAAVADAVMSQPDADTNQPQPVAQQTYVDGFAESSDPSDSEF